MRGEGDDVAETAEAEGEGETVGEAKWTAMRDLERRFPGLDKAKVEYVVLSEGERGLLGVGFVPARVLARLAALPRRPSAGAASAPPAAGAEGVLRALLERVRDGLGLDAAVSVRLDGPALVGAFQGRDLGLVIGKRGQTIDAIQHLATAVVSRLEGERVEVVVDAAGYRDRRRASLEAVADRSAEQVVETGRSTALEPMSAAERKIVHLRLKDRGGIATASEGTEPNRHVVVRPAE